MMKIKHVLLSILILGLVLFLGSCSDAVKAGEINIIQIPDGGYSFKIHQRKQAELPSREGGVYLNIGDITKGQVQVSIIGNQKVLLEKSISNGDINSFELDGIAYKLICTDLDNKLLGEDSMDFTIINEGGSPEIDADKVKTDINYLLDQMSESNIIFIRNGKEHSGEEAASHLRMKLEKSNHEFGSIKEFVNKLATKSSMSGKPYQVKQENDTLIAASQWFEEVLKVK